MRKVGLTEHNRRIAKNTLIKNSKLRTGEVRVNCQGVPMTIIAYHRVDDIDVQFEDGTILRHKSYEKFSSGRLFPCGDGRSTRKRPDRVGESKLNKQGIKMTIIAYRTADDIDVQFEDGYIRYHMTYRLFKLGCIHNEHFANPQTSNHRLHESKLNKQGVLMTIIAYRNAHDIDVSFELGGISEHKGYREFLDGGIAVVPPFPYQIGNITMRSPAYIYNNEGNFYCFCNKCKKSDIMTIREMREHICTD